MRIKANRGRIFGATLADVTAVLPDFESNDVLTVRGTASGPTQDFLRFIAESPVAASINHFTDPFRVEGVGSLDLQLVLPLAKIEASRVKGEYQFARNACGSTRRCRCSPRRAGGWPSPRASWW